MPGRLQLRSGIVDFLAVILAWRIPWTEEPGGAPGHRVTKCQARLNDLHTSCNRQNSNLVWLSLEPELLTTEASGFSGR